MLVTTRGEDRRRKPHQDEGYQLRWQKPHRDKHEEKKSSPHTSATTCNDRGHALKAIAFMEPPKK